MMTASGFRAAGVSPILGRAVTDDDERPGAARVVVIGYEEWQRHFDGDRDVIGRTLRLGATAHTVVGVMPQGFRFPVNHGLWVPLQLLATGYEAGEGPELTVFGRLADGATVEQAQAELTGIGARLAGDARYEHLRAQVVPYVEAFVGVNSSMRGVLVTSIQVALSLLLIVVAVNVAVLVYARTAARMGEIAVRSALGASRRRVVGQLFTEALALSGIAALLGLTTAAFGFEWLRTIVDREDPVGLPYWVDLSVSPSLVAYAAALALLAAVTTGVLPALKATGRTVRTHLQTLSTGGGGLRLGRTWTVLIVAQVTIAVAVLPYAISLLVPSVTRGFAAPEYPVEDFLRLTLSLEDGTPEEQGDPDRSSGIGFVDAVSALVHRLEAQPEVGGVTYASRFPGEERVAGFEVEGTGRHEAVWLNEIDAELLETLDVSLVAGRGFEPTDALTGANSVIVDEVFAEELLGNGNAIGRRVRHVEADGATEEDPQSSVEWLEIVGVVPAFTVPPAFQPKAPKLYRPISLPDAEEGLWLVVRTRPDVTPAAFMGRLREIAADVAPDLVVGELSTARAAERGRATGLLTLAVLTLAVMGSVLLLSAAGVYAMMSFIVTSGMREIGIRSALGAAPVRMVISTFRRAGGQLGLGLVGGLVVSEATARAAGASVLFSGESVYVLPAVVVVVMWVGLVAAVPPTMRGLAIEPSRALRGE